MFGGYSSIGHVLTRPCMSPVVLACIATPFVSMRIFSVLAQVLRLSSSFVGLLGKLSDFIVFQHVMMYCRISSRICPVLNALHLCSLGVSDRGSKVILSKFHCTRMIFGHHLGQCSYSSLRVYPRNPHVGTPLGNFTTYRVLSRICELQCQPQ